MKLALLALSSLAALWLGAGCSNSPPPSAVSEEGGVALGSPCTGAPDECAAPGLCAWPVDGGCSAKGKCVMPQVPCSNPEGGQQILCGCDGMPFALACIYGEGLSPEPVSTPSAACPVADAGTD